ncbi:hypothetical protein [Marinomonas balearica]|uniref:Uncharacterized protein n=1 Tax=Marinomonas balearica TaxID=491947 RepID=A0A4R6MDE8_9GAMM|nr:hypothetical protein [Marinomonas balearica]TDO99583.1 hypothetical protein DFP79_0568 [Marinomonas balearica]
MLYQISLIIFSFLSALLVFLKINSDKLEPIVITFTVRKVIFNFLMFTSLSIIALSMFLYILMFVMFWILFLLIRTKSRGVREKNNDFKRVSFFYKIFNYPIVLPIKWSFPTFLYLISFSFLFFHYKGIYYEKISVFDYVSMSFLILLSFLIFLLEFGYEKVKSVYLVLIPILLVSTFLAPYFTSIIFSTFSDVSPEKVENLLFLMNALSIFITSVLVFSLVYMYFIMSFTFYFFIYHFFLKISFLKKDKMERYISNLYGTKGILILFFYILTLGIPLISALKYVEVPRDLFDQLMSEIFLKENKNSCEGLLSDDKIYFYDSDKVIKYSPDDENEIKYRDVKCSPKPSNNENALN